MRATTPPGQAGFYGIRVKKGNAALRLLELEGNKARCSRTHSAMPMLVMDVGKMGMVVPKRLMQMLVHMRFGSVPPLAMLVLMVLIVLMRVRMRQRLVHVHVFVVLGDMQPHAKAH